MDTLWFSHNMQDDNSYAEEESMTLAREDCDGLLLSSLLDVLISSADKMRAMPPPTTLSARYSCGVCNKVFKYKYLRRNHLRVHSGHRPFNCQNDGCQMKFKWRSSLKCHTKRCPRRAMADEKLVSES